MRDLLSNEDESKSSPKWWTKENGLDFLYVTCHVSWRLGILSLLPLQFSAAIFETLPQYRSDILTSSCLSACIFPRLSWQNITGLDGRQRSTVFFHVLLFFFIQDTREQEVGTTHDSLLLSVFILFILTIFPIKKTSWAWWTRNRPLSKS